MPGLIKPAQWALTPGLVDPKWGWFWARAVFAAPIWEGAGNIRDYTPHKLDLPPSVTPATWETSLRGHVVRSNSGSEAFQTTTPEYLKLGFPVTVFMGITRVSAPTINAALFGVLPNDSGASPFTSFIFGSSGTATRVRFDINNGGSFKALFNSLDAMNCSVGETCDYGVIIKSGDSTAYLNGVLAATDASTFSDPTFTSTSLTTFGDGVNAARDAGVDFHYGYILDGECSEAQLQQVAADPWGMFRMADEVGVVIVPAAVGAFDTFAKRLCMMNFGE